MAFKDHASFYNDPELYDDTLFEDENFEVEFFSAFVKKAKKPMYLGSGSGRLLKHFYKENAKIVGVEVSSEMAKKSRDVVPNAKVIVEDVLNLNLKERFDLVIAPYEFLNHFNPSALAKVIKVVSRHLTSSGTFVAALKNPYDCIEQRGSSKLVYAEKRGNFFEKGYQTVQRDEKKYIDFIEQINLKTNEYTLINMEWYYYLEQELKVALQKNAITTKHVYGDFSKHAFRKTSDTLILVGNKAKP